MKVSIALLLLSFLPARPQSPDIDLGHRLFDSQCGLCHGIGGTGGRGPGLNRPKPRRAADTAALKRVITEGIPGTEMPGAWQLSPREVESLVAYVASLAKVETNPLSGDAAAGEKLYSSHGCASCHIIRGTGNGFGPELTTIGARRSAAWLRESLEKPNASFPDEFEYVEVRENGRTIRGIRVNEDSFTIQLRDRDNRFHSFRKTGAAEIRRLTGESPMPAYRLSAKDLDDLTALLAGLQDDFDGDNE